MTELRNFWSYFGSKWELAPKYPKPQYGTIIEPFAGGAGYSCRYPDRAVILCEKNPIIAGIWRFLIRASAAEILSIPLITCTDDLPAGTIPEIGWLIGMNLNQASTAPRKTQSVGVVRQQASGRKFTGWTPARRERIARQVDQIRHWKIVEGEWFDLPAIEATWFVDPPYQGAGKAYPCGPVGIDYSALADACRLHMPGQVIVCESADATWLPFKPFETVSKLGRSSREGVWLRG